MRGNVPSRALLVAGGIGTRLRQLTDVLPKCLMPICGRPLLDIWLDELLSAGVERVIVNTHHHRESVETFVATSPYADRVTLAFEPELLGTAGTLAKHTAELGRGSALFAHADNLTLFDLPTFAACHAARDAGVVMTMMTFDTDRPETCGIVELDHEGRVVEMHEKQVDPPGNLANAAVYLIEPDVAALAVATPDARDFSLEVIPRLLGKIQTFHNATYHRDIGTPASLALAQLEFPVAEASFRTPDGTLLAEGSPGRRAREDMRRFLAAAAIVYA